MQKEMIFIRLEWNKKYTTIAAYALIVIILAIMFVVFIFKYESIANGFSWIGDVVAPIVIGICIAYVINPLVMWFEDRVFHKLKDDEINIPSIWDKIDFGSKDEEKVKQRAHVKAVKRRRRRRTLAKALSVVISLVIVIAVIVGICIAIVPHVAQSIVDLAEQMPGYARTLEAKLKDIFANNPSLANYISAEFMELNTLLDKIADQIAPVIGSVSAGLIGVVTGILVTLKNVLIGFMIAIYLLFSKERLIAQFKKILFALFKNNKCQRILAVCRKSNNIFKTYIISNLLDAMIIFIFMSIGMALMDMPYAMLISMVCGITNLIPFFGPFIGAIPCGVLILLVDPIKVIWFGIFVLVLQQVDGNIIKPFLFGETMGLPALWVLVSIIVSGGLFGIPGMLLGAPVFAVIYLLFAEFISGKLEKKNLPTDTDRYYDTDSYDNQYAEPTVDTE
ncbi:MAG: AI-2E family transporter [Oscillospiraceae bacterium]|nr:AI-2E family transporter [Oscillospiraceae bacterium]